MREKSYKNVTTSLQFRTRFKIHSCLLIFKITFSDKGNTQMLKPKSEAREKV